MRTLRTTPAHPRRTLRRAAGAACLALALGGLAACGADDAEATGEKTTATAAEQATQVTVEDPWVRATEGAEDPSMTAAFMLLDNTGEADATLVGATTEVAGMTQIHEMAEIDGEMVMREKEGGLSLAPGRGQLLQPGGDHLMLMEMTEDLAPGDEVTFTLEFADGSTQEVTAPVKPFTEETGHYHEPGTPKNHQH